MESNGFKYQFRRIDDDAFVVIVNGKEQSIFRVKNWLNGLKARPNGPGIGKTNKFSITESKYHGFYE